MDLLRGYPGAGITTGRVLFRVPACVSRSRYTPTAAMCLLAWCIGACLPCYAGVLGFEESFGGDGAFDGFDNPDWKIVGNSVFAEGGLLVDNRLGPEPNAEFDKISRLAGGVGSYTATLEFSQLLFETAEPPKNGEGSLEFFNRFLTNDGRIAGEVFVSLTDFSDLKQIEGHPLFMAIAGLWGAVDIPTRTVDRPMATPAKLGIRYDGDKNRFQILYDRDTTDNLPANTFGPFPLTFSNATRMEFGFFAYSSNATVRQRAVASKFSVVPKSEMAGDFNGNDALDIGDIHTLMKEIRTGGDEPRFDLTGDGLIDNLDASYWVHDLKTTYFGDSNLDGEFTSVDLVRAFQFGQYEDAAAENSTWYTGDWNGDAEFTASDLVLAFQDGGYERGPRQAVGIAAEPQSSFRMLLVGIPVGVRFLRRRSLDVASD